MTSPGRNRTIALAFLLSLALLPTGCGSSSGGAGGGEPPDYERALAGSPPPLAALHEQANEILPGGVDAYERRIEALAGYPIVVNFWASWCGPCRYEFPVLQKLSTRYGKRVAFLAVNVQDADDDAADFLREEPVPYPSYRDADKEILQGLGGLGGLPDNAFYNREGELCHLKQGPYPQDEELEADLRRFALDEECESG